MTKNQFLSLLQKYLKAEASSGEQNLLHAYYDLFMADPDVLALLNAEERTRLGTQIKSGIDKAITLKTDPFPWKRIMSIAAAVAAIIFGAWFYKDYAARKTAGSQLEMAMHNEIIPGPSTTIPGENDIAAGGKGATLKLSGGQYFFECG